MVVLGGLVVIVLATGPKFAGSNPAEGNVFLKIRSTTSFGREVNPSVSSRKILRHVKDPCEV
jgi:hypothetical protein